MKAEWHHEYGGSDILICGPIVCELCKVDKFNFEPDEDIEEDRFCEFRFVNPHIIIKSDDKKQAVTALLRSRLIEASKLLLED